MALVAVRDVVRDVVAELAPEELPLVDGLAVYDDDSVVRRLRRAKPRREPLGFGWGEVVGLLTPVVWLVLDQVAERFADAAVAGTTRKARGLLRRFRRGSRPPATIPSLTEDQLAELRRDLLDQMQQPESEEWTAEQVVDVIIRRLARGADPDPAASPVGPSPAS
ncbi:hypothetical protein [Micromonospora eburnea]|uniref:Uncharacterized protein n=1 Tax=Micromonospora eburnea TaxID=227316 RepID=A0A1C6UAV4_9ACTN|nr:hypothetical protein [Micromonospora eburnea]SCL51041.1 hypothetical protein GA0070604_2270 [Micromonospora eburnea]